MAGREVSDNMDQLIRKKAVSGASGALMILAAALLALMFLATGCSGSGSSSGGSSGSGGSKDLDSVIKSASEYLVENVPVDSVDSMGGGWVPFALKMSGTDAADDDYYAAYYDSIRAIAKSQKGVLSEDHPTAHERVSINLKAIGQDPASVEGYDLMEKVDDYDAICEQGLNAEIYALVAANYCGYKLKNEDKYLYDIVVSQSPDGAFGMDADHPDSDMTAMALQALAPYDGRIDGNDAAKRDDRAEGAIDRALEWLSAKQQEDGSFGNAESTAQVMIALGCLGRDPASDEDFIKGDNSLLDGIIVFQTGRGFCHEAGGEEDIMPTEQALMGLDAAKMAQSGQRMFA